MGVGAGLYMNVVVVKKFTFAISSPDEFLVMFVNTYYVVAYLTTDAEYAANLVNINVWL